MTGSGLLLAMNATFFGALFVIVLREIGDNETWKLVCGILYKMLFGASATLFVLFVLACMGVDIY